MFTIDQNKAPLFEALKKYVTDDTLPFHVPGHKQGRGNKELTDFLGYNAMSIDLTCLEDLDNICNPVSVIKQAQQLAAEIYKAENAYFLCNGTTSGIQAMIMSVCEPGDKIIVPRNAHKSAIGGIILSGAKPIYVEPYIDSYMGVAMGVTPETIEKAILKNPDAKAVFIINPTYYGVASDLKKIVKICHSYGKPVIADEAHGAHLVFNDELPLSAMEAGADLSASSTHKLVGSLTQSSILLHQGTLVNPKRVKSVLNLTQTTSPSYILLASIDLARKQMALQGKELINETLELAKWAKEELAHIPGLYILNKDILNNPGCHSIDSTKLVFNVRALGLSGYEVERILRKKYSIQVELSDLFNVICLITLGDTKETISQLLSAIKEIVADCPVNKVVKYSIPLPSIPEMVIQPRQAFNADTKIVAFDDAEGEISAESIMAYPPGIPIICPGEKITREIIDYINILRNEEAQLQGTEDPEVKKIKVLNRRLILIQNSDQVSDVG